MGCLHSSFCNGFTAAATGRPWSFDPLCRHRCGKRSSAEMVLPEWGCHFRASWPSSELSFLNGFQKDSKHANAAEKLRWSLKLWDSHDKIETTFCILHLCKLVKRTPVADTSSTVPYLQHIATWEAFLILLDFNVNDYLKKTHRRPFRIRLSDGSQENNKGEMKVLCALGMVPDVLHEALLRCGKIPSCLSS